MDDSTIIIIASFLIMLAVSLLGLFLYLIRSSRTESSMMIKRLQRSVQKLSQMNYSNERTFFELEEYLKRRTKNLLTMKKVMHGTQAVQTDDLELGILPEAKASQTDFEKAGTLTEDLELGLVLEFKKASQTSLSKVGRLPPLLVRPALSSKTHISTSG